MLESKFFLMIIFASLFIIQVVYIWGFLGPQKRIEKMRGACKGDIQQGIVKGLLEWKDLEILAQRWNQSRTDIHWILSDLLHDSLTTKDDTGKILYQRVKELLDTEQNLEPFAELPESIRIHMENISSRFRDSGDAVLRPLASSICDTIVEADRKTANQAKLAKWSFLVGIISLSVGIASLIFAITQMMTIVEQKAQNQTVSKLEYVVNPHGNAKSK